MTHRRVRLIEDQVVAAIGAVTAGTVVEVAAVKTEVETVAVIAVVGIADRAVIADPGDMATRKTAAFRKSSSKSGAVRRWSRAVGVSVSALLSWSEIANPASAWVTENQAKFHPPLIRQKSLHHAA